MLEYEFLEAAPVRITQIAKSEGLPEEALAYWEGCLTEALVRIAMGSSYFSGIGALAKNYTAPSSLSISLLTRSCLDANSRAWWVLDEQASARERISRGLSERLYGLRKSQGQFTSGAALAPKDSSDIEAFEKSVAESGLEFQPRLSLPELLQLVASGEGEYCSLQDPLYSMLSASPQGGLQVAMFSEDYCNPFQSVYWAAQGIVKCLHALAKYSSDRVTLDALHYFRANSEKPLEAVRQAHRS